MKKIFFVGFLVFISITLFSCKIDNNDINANSDTPIFENINEGYLEEIEVLLGNSVDLFNNVRAYNEFDKNEVTVSISSMGIFDINRVGSYTIDYLAINDYGNKATAKRIVNVLNNDSDILEFPKFKDTSNGYLEPLEVLKDSEVNLLDGIFAIDEDGNDIAVTIESDGGFNINITGYYLITYEAKDSKGNINLAFRNVNVVEKSIVVYDALFIGSNKFSYSYNNENALNYTPSGTQFRTSDQIQVMDKDFFVNLFEEKKSSHTNNGQIPYFPNGVILIVDSNFKVKHIRVATELVEIDSNGNLKNENLNWTNNIDATNGGGNFKNIIETINEVIPNGGHIMFAPPAGKQLAKKFLIQNLFNPNYQSGTISARDFTVDITTLKIKLVEDYEELLSDDEYENEDKDKVIVHDKYLDGIPVTTYYYNDGEKKPVIFFFHGFESNRKSGIQNRGTELAKKGFYVISIDAYLHGERQPAYFKNLSYSDKQKEIVNIQIQTAVDAKNIYYKYYQQHKYVDPTKVFSFGVSMGAGTAVYIASLMDELNTVISMLGSPSFVDFYSHKQKEYNWQTNSEFFTNLNNYIKHDPYINYELYENKNIFFANGSNDEVVPEIFAKKFKERMINNNNILFKSYNTAHSSTVEMHNDCYDFLNNNY